MQEQGRVKMKIRSGFVSNSSSASFVIKKDKLTPVQIDMIKRHKEMADKIDEAVGNSQRHEYGTRHKGAYIYTPKTAEEIEKEKEENKKNKKCNHPDIIECADCNPEIYPDHETWNDTIFVGSYDCSDGDVWEIEETENVIKGSTYLDNFDMEVFLEEIGIPKELIQMRD